MRVAKAGIHAEAMRPRLFDVTGGIDDKSVKVLIPPVSLNNFGFLAMPEAKPRGHFSPFLSYIFEEKMLL